jgi:UDP-N-acetylmuramate dehydrogenase
VPTRVNVPLAELTTLRVGGPASQLIEADTAETLVQLVRDADAGNEPVLLIGGGSNLVVSDAGFSGLAVLIRTHGLRRIENRLIAPAGQSWDELVSYAVNEQLAGIECLAGIPGLVGATPIQNVGAYGQEVSEVITRVQAYDRARGVLRDLRPTECGFGYRSSRFKLEHGRWIITEVEFTLRPSATSAPVRYGELSRLLGLDPASGTPATPSAPLATVRDAVLGLRRSKGMVLDASDADTASAGSFFTNPVLDARQYAALTERAGGQVPAFAQPPEPAECFKVPAAWLIDRAGFPKGYGDGPARLSTKHVLAITNRGGANTADVLALAREVRDGVRERLGIQLVNEPVLVGEAL